MKKKLLEVARKARNAVLSEQLDSHVDIGHRIIKDFPRLKKEFQKVGRGKISSKWRSKKQ